MTATRILPLLGGCNFRDFGGYPAADGAAVRWGRLYRSGVLSRLTAGDLDTINGLGLRMVCDLRRTDERAHNPNPDFGTAVTTLSWQTETETSPLRNERFISADSRETARAAMHEMYVRLPFVLRPRLRGVFEGLQKSCPEAGAFIVHCSAGKDRTGIAVALILTALGVPRDVVIEDYALTNTAVDLRQQLLGQGATGAGMAVTAAPVLALSEPAREAILAANPDYIVASLDAIDARHGSVLAYLDAELGVDLVAIERLRESLLTTA